LLAKVSILFVTSKLFAVKVWLIEKKNLSLQTLIT